MRERGDERESKKREDQRAKRKKTPHLLALPLPLLLLLRRRRHRASHRHRRDGDPEAQQHDGQGASCSSGEGGRPVVVLLLRRFLRLWAPLCSVNITIAALLLPFSFSVDPRSAAVRLCRRGVLDLASCREGEGDEAADSSVGRGLVGNRHRRECASS